MRMSERELEALKKRKPAAGGKAMKGLRALGRLKSGEMNKTETAYAGHLETLKQAGEVLWYRFEGIKLKLADHTHLTVDFAVMTQEGYIELHDVKGAKAIVQDDAKVKMKVAASQFPFRFFFVYPVDKRRSGWTLEEV